MTGLARSDYIRRLVDDAPALTPEQADRLAVLLRTTPTLTDSDGVPATGTPTATTIETELTRARLPHDGTDFSTRRPA